MKEDATRKKNDNMPSSAPDSKKRVSKVKVALILGHTASHRGNKITSDDFTHDWSFYVRGVEGSKIHNYIERVIFKLHESFSNPNQVITKPPFEIKEQGYGTFILEVEVRFRNKREPKSITYKYDLVLPAEGVAPIKRCRKEILTFTNPNTEFMAKLIEGGGVLHHFDTQGNLISNSGTSTPSPIPKVQPTTSSSNTNKDQPPKPVAAASTASDSDDIRKTKELRKEKKKEKRVKEVEETSASKEVKKQKKPVKPPESKVSVDMKERPKEKPISNFLADFGDVESSDEEKYFKEEESPLEKVSTKLNETSSSSTPKKISQKPKLQKNKHKHMKEGPQLLEFDNLDEIKPKKKQKAKPETPKYVVPDKEKNPDKTEHKPSKNKDLKSAKASSKESEIHKPLQKDESLLEFDSINRIKSNKSGEKTLSSKQKLESHSTSKMSKKNATISEYQDQEKSFSKKSRKRSSSLSSDTDGGSKEDEEGDNRSMASDPPETYESQSVSKQKKAQKPVRTDSSRSHEKKSAPKVDPFMEFDSVSSLKVVKKVPERPRPSEKMKKSRIDDCKDISEKSKPSPSKMQLKKQSEKIVNSRKRSSSLSSDSEDEMQEDGEIQSSSPNSPNVKIETKQNQSSIEEHDVYKYRQKEKKNKHKAVKKESEGDYSSHFVTPSAAFSDTDNFQKSSTKLSVKEEVTETYAYDKSSLDFTAPSQEPPSNSVRRMQNHFSSSSTEDTVNPVDNEAETAPNIHPSPVPSTDHLQFMLNLYSKIHQLQKTNDKSMITEVVNILASDGRSTMNLKEDNVSFDLVNCDMETLRSIDNLLL